MISDDVDLSTTLRCTKHRGEIDPALPCVIDYRAAQKRDIKIVCHPLPEAVQYVFLR